MTQLYRHATRAAIGSFGLCPSPHPCVEPLSSATVIEPVARLAAHCYQDDVALAAADGWTVEAVARGYNGVVFRACSGAIELAAKVSQIDERDRAQRELSALQLIQRHGFAVAPKPVGVARAPDGVAVDVLLTSWCHGAPAEATAASAPIWNTIIETYAEVHRLPLGDDATDLRPAVLGVRVNQVLEDAHSRARRLGQRTLTRLIAAAERTVHARLSTEHGRSLIHCDASLRNFLRDSSGIAIVDWENAGWGDPCFDIANIVMTPQLAHHSLDEWDALFVKHAELLGAPHLAERTRAHAPVMAAWWVVRLRQELIAPTPRLAGVSRPDEASREALLAACEERATRLLASRN